MTDSQPIGRWHALPSGFFRRFPDGKTAYVAKDVGRGAWWWLERDGVLVAEGSALTDYRAVAAVQLLATSVYDGT